MFTSDTTPRVFGVSPGQDFASVLAKGLKARMAGSPPEAMARVRVIVNTARMRERFREALIAQGAGFLPKIELIDELAPASDVNPLGTRLDLAQAVRALLDQQPDLAPRTVAFSLANDLYRLLDEMQGEGVSVSALDELDVSNHSEHWTRSLQFIRLIAKHLGAMGGSQGRLRGAIQAQIAEWARNPPQTPIIVAGSTGSRGPSALLLHAVAQLPQGCVILPGFDRHMPDPVWKTLDDALTNEDHPQYRFAKLLKGLNLEKGHVRHWFDEQGAPAGRNALLSLALRPAPVTDQWITEGAALGDMQDITQGMSLIVARGPLQEASAIALRLRAAAAEGKRAALITPDRTLARRVTAALDRWLLRPDDSAGRPLSLSAPGRFMRLTAQMMRTAPESEALIALLKHPLANSAGERGDHLRFLRELELYLRRRAIPYPEASVLEEWAGDDEGRKSWGAWLNSALSLLPKVAEQGLHAWIDAHMRLASRLAAGPDGADTGQLWLESSGEKTKALFERLQEVGARGGEMTAYDYSALLETVFASEEIRESVESNPSIMIWGTLEARAQWADVVILGGMNEGTWPAATTPDAWFNRAMRVEAGLLVPERQIGLSAHDFQIAVAAPEVVLTRSERNSDAETVPSRWVNRLLNLIGGLPAQNGAAAIEAMTSRGQHWLDLADALEADLSDVPVHCRVRNPRPAPAPPVAARPRSLSVTRAETLIRDPYAIYAQYVLGLKSLNPLTPDADTRLRGISLHKVMDEFVAKCAPGTVVPLEDFMAVAERVLTKECPWPGVRLRWLAKLRNVAPEILAWHASVTDKPVLSERKGTMTLQDPVFTLTGVPDRIDQTEDGSLRLYDYKTGVPPTKAQQAKFSKQLLFLAMMAEDGAFKGLEPRPVESAAYVGIGSKFSTVDANANQDNIAKHRKELREMLATYLDPEQGFTALRAIEKEENTGYFDDLARRGEWSLTDDAVTIKVGDHDG